MAKNTTVSDPLYGTAVTAPYALQAGAGAMLGVLRRRFLENVTSCREHTTTGTCTSST
jgi:hypothetical protein